MQNESRKLLSNLPPYTKESTYFCCQEPKEVPDVAEEGEIGSEMAVSWPLNVQGMSRVFHCVRENLCFPCCVTNPPSYKYCTGSRLCVVKSEMAGRD